jgi:hypothetical protein
MVKRNEQVIAKPLRLISEKIMLKIYGNPETATLKPATLKPAVSAMSQYTLPVDYTRLTQPERRLIREEYVRRQEGNCSHCGTSLKSQARDKVLALRINARLFPASFFKWPVHLHHSHDTGMTIGAVHSHCNAVLWQYHGE